jgi:hypothetical protein
MATTVEGLFNLPTQQQAAQQYYEGLLTSPGQMNNLSLMQQLSALGANAGASIGYAGGRLLGGKAPDEVRIQGVNEAMAEATRMGGTDAEMYSNLAKGLAARGLTQDAMAATERARTAKRDEQAMTLAASQEARAVKGDIRLDAQEGRNVAAEARTAEEFTQKRTRFEQESQLFPNVLKKSGLEVLNLEEAQRGDVGNIRYLEQSVATGVDPSTGKILMPQDLAVAKGKIVDIKTKLANTQAEINMKREHYQAQANHWKAMEAQGASSNALAREKMNQENFSKEAFIQVPSEFPGQPPQKVYVGSKNKEGKVRGKNGLFYDNENEAAIAQGLGTTSAAAPATTPAPAAEQPTNVDRRGAWDRLMNNPQPAAAPAAKVPANTAPGWSDKYKQ